MITVEIQECIRRAYFAEHKPKRQIAREPGCSRETVDKAVVSAEGYNGLAVYPQPAQSVISRPQAGAIQVTHRSTPGGVRDDAAKATLHGAHNLQAATNRRLCR